MAFRIGRSRAQHTFPTSPGAQTQPFARNFAQGPAAPQEITASPVLVGWASIESGAPAGTSVPITPKVTGLLLVTGVIELSNGDETQVTVTAQVTVGGTPIGPISQVSVPGVGFATIPIQTLVAETIGTTYDIGVSLTATVLSEITLNTDDSTLSVREVPLATG